MGVPDSSTAAALGYALEVLCDVGCGVWDVWWCGMCVDVWDVSYHVFVLVCVCSHHTL